MKQTVKYSGAIFVKSGQYLFGKRSADLSSYPGVWDIIGGHLEPGETPEIALKRECNEEVFIEPTEFRLFKVVEQTLEGPGNMFCLYLYFVTAWGGGEPVNCSDEHSEIKWFYRHELQELLLATPEYLNIIDEWLLEMQDGQIQ